MRRRFATNPEMDAGHNNDFDVAVSVSFASTVKGQGEGIYTVASNLNPGVASDSLSSSERRPVVGSTLMCP